ncbi:sugar ABC transporter permease [Enterovirga sp. DB1703]|uniref:Sugar ABC transporter permease n=2 Tax=Enterovirga aerilata TaxID=2730920 RepID=A0A849IFR3_9HYPH|nr:sugar ABC transporter permease [Enterovirga sp. DB1703]
MAVRRRLALPAWRPKGLLGLALLAPSLVFLGLFTYWPVLQVLWQSLHAEARRQTVFVGLGNYRALFADPAFAAALVNNLVYALGTVVPSLVLALGFALALSSSTRLNAALRAILFLPVLIPLVAASSLFLFIFLPQVGLLDHYLAKLGVQGANWLGDPDVALWSLMGLTIWKNAGYYMLFFLAGLQGIPEESYEAARLDGANSWQRLRYVTLPYLRPTLSFVAVIALLNVVTQVDHIFILTKGGPSDSTNLLLFYVYQQAVERYDLGKAAAATVVSLALLLALSATSLRRMERRTDAEEAR